MALDVTTHLPDISAEPNGAQTAPVWPEPEPLSELAPIIDRLYWPPLANMAPPLAAEVPEPQFIIQTQDQLVVADNWGDQRSSLWILERNPDGSLTNAREIELDFQMSQQWVEGDRLVVVGNYWQWPEESQTTLWGPKQHTIILGIDLKNAVELSRVDLPGCFTQALPVTGGLIVQTQQAAPYPIPSDGGYWNDGYWQDGSPEFSIGPVFNPFETWSELTLLQWSERGLETVWMEPTRPGTIQAMGDQIVFLTSEVTLLDPWDIPRPDQLPPSLAANFVACEPPTIPLAWPAVKTQLVLKHYQVTAGALDLIGELKLEHEDFDTRIQLSDDGTHILVTHLNYQYDETGIWIGSTLFEWYDLSLATPTLVQQTALDGFTGEVKLLSDQRAIAISYSPADEVLLIDLQARSNDELSVTRIALPHDLQLSAQQLVVLGDRLVLGGTNPWQPLLGPPALKDPAQPVVGEEQVLVDPIVDPPAVMGFPDAPSAALVVISLVDASVLSETFFADQTAISQLFVIDATAASLGWVSLVNETDWQWHERVSFGKLGVFGSLDDIQEITRENSWAYYAVNPTSLYALANNALREIRWSNPSETQQLVSQVNPDRGQIVANPGVFERDWTGEPQSLDVLSNDLLPRTTHASSRFVELIDAPDEISLDENGKILIPAGYQLLTEQIFRYRVSDGYGESVASITLESSTVLLSAIEQVRQYAAEDLSVPIMDITVVSATYTDGNPLPANPLDDQPSATDWGFIVEIQTPTTIARSLTHIDGSIDLVSQMTLREVTESTEWPGKLDVNGDGHMTALDVLCIINVMNRPIPTSGNGPQPLDAVSGLCDIDGDQHVTESDARVIVDELNSRLKNAPLEYRPVAEGERSAKLPQNVDAVFEHWPQNAARVHLPSTLGQAWHVGLDNLSTPGFRNRGRNPIR